MKLLLATEANEGMGHIAPWTEFVVQAKRQGMDIHMAAPNPAQLDRLMGHYLSMNVWQAPTLRYVAPQGVASPKSWPELLVTLGYGDTDCLTGMVKAWVNLLKSLSPDVVLADYAPALMIAAKVCSIRLLEVGSGFCVPPLLNGACLFPGARANSPTAIASATNRLVGSFSAALCAVGCSTVFTSLGELVSWPEKRIVTSPPELDHYGVRDDVFHVGFLSARNHRTEVKAIQKREPPFIVGYLKVATPGLEVLVAELREAEVSAYLVIPDCNEKMKSTNERFIITSELIDLPSALRLANIYVSNGGLHGVGQALHAGCWPIVVPMQAEQAAMARQLVKNSWGGLWMAELPVASRQAWRTRLKFDSRPNIFRVEEFTAERKLLDIINSSC